MGTKVGLTGITFGDASVQNTAAVTGVTSLTAGSGISLSGSTGAVTVTNSSPGAVSSVNGQTGAVVTTSLYSIGMTVIGRPQDLTDYAVGSTIAGSSLYTAPGTTSYYYPAASGWLGQGGTLSATLINTGTWRCVTRAYGDTANYSYSGTWVRYV
jgi:hypothetical protein